VVDYVLARAGGAEQRAIDGAIERALEHTDLLLAGSMERAMHALHTEPPPADADGV